jgi:hypothetical protein
VLCRLGDEEYTSRPFYGSRRMVVFLKTAGHVVNRKHVQGLMRDMGLRGWRRGRTPAVHIRSTRSIRKAFTDVLKRESVDRISDTGQRVTQRRIEQRMPCRGRPWRMKLSSGPGRALRGSANQLQRRYFRLPI